MKLKGNWKTKEIWLDGELLLPNVSQQLVNHSPDGFNWGYAGSAPAQLALAICFQIIQDKDIALGIYQHFKDAVIKDLPQKNFDEKITFDVKALASWYVNRNR